MSVEELGKRVALTRLCGLAQLSRQGYYRVRRERQVQALAEEELVARVCEVRRRHPRLGGRKLLAVLRGQEERGLPAVGRDRFFELLRRHDLLVPARRRRARTTDSRHGFRVYRDLVKEAPPPSAPHQRWVADLTYLATLEGFAYLALITDACSRQIVGYHVSDSLEASGCVRALRMAQRQLPAGCRVTHHSDRGSQYCGEAYQKQLARRATLVSMTENGNCYDNAMAERVNGILKTEYLLGTTFPAKAAAYAATRQAIELYNTERPHFALGLKTPAQVHQAVGG